MPICELPPVHATYRQEIQSLLPQPASDRSSIDYVLTHAGDVVNDVAGLKAQWQKAYRELAASDQFPSLDPRIFNSEQDFADFDMQHGLEPGTTLALLAITIVAADKSEQLRGSSGGVLNVKPDQTFFPMIIDDAVLPNRVFRAEELSPDCSLALKVGAIAPLGARLDACSESKLLLLQESRLQNLIGLEIEQHLEAGHYDKLRSYCEIAAAMSQSPYLDELRDVERAVLKKSARDSVQQRFTEEINRFTSPENLPDALRMELLRYEAARRATPELDLCVTPLLAVAQGSGSSITVELEKNDIKIKLGDLWADFRSQLLDVVAPSQRKAAATAIHTVHLSRVLNDESKKMIQRGAMSKIRACLDAFVARVNCPTIAWEGL